MTDSIIDIIRQVVRQEMRNLYTAEIGEVTAVFPHAAASDKDNYQCSVKLKNKKQDDGSDFELRRVPVTTPHIGQVNIPNVGDLVLLAFVGGNINAPVITGRLYNDADQPPVNQAGEFILQHNLQNGSSLKIDGSGVLTLTSQQGKSVATVEDNNVLLETSNGQVKISLDSGGVTIDAASNNVTVKSSGGNITIGDASTGQVKVGGRMLANAVGDNDDIILSIHTHVGNLGIPCPIMVPTEKINSIQAKARNTQVG